MARLGLIVFLASLAMFFLAGIAAFYLLRFTSEQWPGRDAIHFPTGLWISTALLAVSSFTMQRAITTIAAGRSAAFRKAMLATTALGVAFLLFQVANWREMISAGLPIGANLFAWLFFTLTALHALHVVGGLIPLTVVTARACAGRYTPRNCAGVRHCGLYWHFLGVVWLMLLVTLRMPI